MPRTWFVMTRHSPEGRQLAARLLARGNRVITTARNPLLLDDLKTRHATTLTVYTADDADPTQLGNTLHRAFCEHGPIDTVVGPESVLRAALPHLMTQRSGRMICPPHHTRPESLLTVTVASQDTTGLDSWQETVPAKPGNHTSVSDEQLHQLQPGMFGQPPRIGLPEGRRSTRAHGR